MTMFLLVFSLLAFSQRVVCVSEYNYALQRDMLQEKEKEFAGYNISLSANEMIVNNYMEYLKWEEFERTRDAFPPSRPIETVLDDIKASKIYQVLKKFPKGGNMHIHQNHILSKRKMLGEIFNSTMLDYLCVDTSHGNTWRLDFYETPPFGWFKVKADLKTYSMENLLKHITLINVLSDKAKANPTDSNIRWNEMNPLFSSAGSEIVRFANYTQWHIKALFESALEENIQYLEARSSHHDIFYVNDSAHGGHMYYNDPDDAMWYDSVRRILNDFKIDHPDFIGFREIINGKRYTNAQSVKYEIDRTIRLRQKYPDIIGGFDLVAEEDKGYSLLFFIDDFNDEKFQNAHLPLYFHTSETNWPNDLLTSLHSDDPVSTLDNVYEAVVLGSKRVGHGLGFIKHPYLMQELKERKVAVEANPVSNMLLGYVTDQRHHPAITYIRYGIPVVLGSDDPGSMGYDEFTVDWYEAFMAWGLNLADLRQLALNSLNYSTMTVNEKSAAFQKWDVSWNKFIHDMALEACAVNLSASMPEVHRIYPADGHVANQTKVRVFGRNFQSAICQHIVCKFGSLQTRGQYVYNHMITCPFPANRHAGSYQFSISLNGGNHFVQTNLTFTNTVHGISPGLVG